MTKTKARLAVTATQILLALAAFSPAQAQHRTTTRKYNTPPPPVAKRKHMAFDADSKVIGISAGFGINYGYYGDASSLPAIAVTYDQGLHIKGDIGPGVISLGGIVGIKTAHYDYGAGDYRARWTNTIVGVRGAYHMNLFDNEHIDVYGGLMVGVRIYKYSDSYYDNFPGGDPYHYKSVYPAAGAFVGARYNFSSNIGVFGELGYDISFLRLGISATF